MGTTATTTSMPANPMLAEILARIAADETMEEELCGVCERPGGDTPWASGVSRTAHERCVEQIKPCENLSTAMINGFCHDQINRQLAHKEVVMAVTQRCNGLSLKTFIEQDGPQALTKLFNTIGVDAATLYKSV
jgi:hypothetical protein